MIGPVITVSTAGYRDDSAKGRGSGEPVGGMSQDTLSRSCTKPYSDQKAPFDWFPNSSQSLEGDSDADALSHVLRLPRKVVGLVADLGKDLVSLPFRAIRYWISGGR